MSLFAVFCQGTYAESRPYSRLHENSPAALVYARARPTRSSFRHWSASLPAICVLTIACSRPIGARAVALLAMAWSYAFVSIGPSTVAGGAGRLAGDAAGLGTRGGQFRLKRSATSFDEFGRNTESIEAAVEVAKTNPMITSVVVYELARM